MCITCWFFFLRNSKMNRISCRYRIRRSRWPFRRATQYYIILRLEYFTPRVIIINVFHYLQGQCSLKHPLEILYTRTISLNQSLLRLNYVFYDPVKLAKYDSGTQYVLKYAIGIWQVNEKNELQLVNVKL